MAHTICEVCERRYVFTDKVTVCDVCKKTHTVKGILMDLASTDMPQEFMVDEMAQVLHRESVKLSDSEIRDICDNYFQNHGKNAEALEESNQLYMSLDHVNNMMLDVEL